MRRLHWLCTVGVVLAWPALAQAQPSKPALTIEQVVTHFLERNLAVEAARHRVDIARAEQIAARLHPNPTLTLSAENLRFAGPTPAGELYEVGATYSQPIERSDKRRHRRDVADASVVVAEAQFAATLGQRLLAVKRAFYETLAARDSVEHALEHRRAFESLVTVTEARFREGAVAEGELIKVRLERGRLDAAISQAEFTLRQAGIKLLDMLGETDFANAGAVAGDAVLPATAVPDVAALKTEALARSPALRAAEQAVVLAERRVDLERSRNTGDVSPFVGLRRVGENSTVLVGITIPLPFTDRNEGGIARAAAEARVARSESTLRKNAVLADVESAHQAWQSARERVATFETGLLRQADDALAIAQRAYQEGAIELLGYLEAQRTRMDIRHQYRQSVLEARLGLALLELAVGRDVTR